MPKPQFEVALSFAGEQRFYVRSVADFLRDAKISLFYDDYEKTRLWGKDLVEELDRAFRKDSRFVVMFVSADYKRKPWTRHERRSALAAALQHDREYVLPVRFDNTDLDGLSPSLTYVDAREVDPEALGNMIIEKLRLLERSYEAGVDELEVWRLVQSRFAASAFDGHSTRLHGGQWNAPGVRVVYTADSVCVALLEMFAVRDPTFYLNRADDFVALKAHLSLSTGIEVVQGTADFLRWGISPTQESIQALVTQWTTAGETCVLAVPSKVLPSERMYLLNPEHPDFESLEVLAEKPVGDLAFFVPRR